MIPTRCRRGSILFTALAVSSILLIWAVAAVQQANFQSRANLHAYRKSELYYLSKRAANRAVYQLNTNRSWLGQHSGRDNADESTPGTRCWVEASGSSLTLRCEAWSGSQHESLDVPLLADSDSSMHVYSVGPSSNGGGDLISWTSRAQDGWNALPPIPGAANIVSVATMPNGDIFAVAQSALWRYRKGRGWVRMPDTPGDVGLLSVSTGPDQLVCKSNRNSVLVFPLKGMNWRSLPAPEGQTLDTVIAEPNGSAECLATTAEGIYRHQQGQWQALPLPTPVAYDVKSGAALPAAALDFSGGIAVGKNGEVYLASNPAGSASFLYTLQAGTWSASPPVHQVAWLDNQATSLPGYTNRLEHLVTDSQGQIWAQTSNADGTQVANVHLILP